MWYLDDGVFMGTVRPLAGPAPAGTEAEPAADDGVGPGLGSRVVPLSSRDPPASWGENGGVGGSTAPSTPRRWGPSWGH